MASYIIVFTDKDEPELATKQVFAEQEQAQARAEKIFLDSGRELAVRHVKATIMQDGVIGQYFGYEIEGGARVWV